MSTTDLMDKAVALAKTMSDKHFHVFVRDANAHTITLEVWYGLINLNYNVHTQTMIEGRVLLEKILGEELRHYVSKEEMKLDETGLMLHCSITGKLKPYVDIVNPIPSYILAPRIVDDSGKVLSLKRYFSEGNPILRRRMETKAVYNPATKTLHMTPWDEEPPVGFDNFVYSLSDMELVALQKQAREVDDEESLSLVLAELGRRQRNRASFFKTDAAAKGEVYGPVTG